MPVTRLNHAVLYVRDVQVTRDFYESVLGFRTLVWVPGKAAFFQAPGSTNDHDLGTFQIGSGAGPSPAGRSTVGLYHLAWEVPTIGDLAEASRILAENRALGGASDHGVSKSLYGADPDGNEFEIMWRVPREAWGDAEEHGVVQPLDLDAEVARWGADATPH
jgi:catechol-2,3-dioxygenase